MDITNNFVHANAARDVTTLIGLVPKFFGPAFILTLNQTAGRVNIYTK